MLLFNYLHYIWFSTTLYILLLFVFDEGLTRM